MLEESDFIMRKWLIYLIIRYSKCDFKNCFTELNHKIDVYTFIHVRPIINNFISELKLIDIDELLINKIYETLSLHVIKFSIYEKSSDITICDVVKKSYLENIEEYEILISFIKRKLN